MPHSTHCGNFCKRLLVVWCVHFTAMDFLAFSQPPPCPVTWGPTVQISNTPTSAFGPKLALAGDTIHVTYEARGIYYRLSTDAGANWHPQIRLIPVDSINPGTKPIAAFRNNVYMVWGNRNASGEVTSIKILRSTDAGRTWLEPQVLWRNVSSFERLVGPRVAAYDSMVYVVMGRPSGLQPWFLTRSTDYGVSFDSVRQITFSSYGAFTGAAGICAIGRNVHFTFERSIPPSGSEIVYTRSTNWGLSWDSLTILSTIDNYQAWAPNVAADDAGNVYVSWQDAKYGSIGGFAGTVLLRKSTDNGQTWLPEVLVSPLPSAGGSSLSVDRDFVHVVWSDERSGLFNSTIQYRGSSDGGNTWCDEQTIGDTLDVHTDQNVAAGRGIAYTAWSSYGRLPSPPANIYFRKGEYPIVRVVDPFSIAENFTMSKAYPNPFNPTTKIEYTLPNRGEVEVEIFDILGRRVFESKHYVHRVGTHELVVNGTQWPSGVYYVCIRFENKRFVQKVILIR